VAASLRRTAHESLENPGGIEYNRGGMVPAIGAGRLERR
jgi:hypothetical protein